jgi:hypothetical protein
LEFGEDGQIKSLRTVGTGFIFRSKDKPMVRIGAEWRPDPRDTGANILIPIRVQFLEHGVCVTDSDGQTQTFSSDEYDIQIDYLTDNIVMGGGCGDCSTCNGCHV